MVKVSKFAAALVALALLLSAAPRLMAADATTISGTVIGVDGKTPVANATVRLMKADAAQPKAASKKLADEPGPGADKGRKPGKGGPAALKETTTNDKGEFTFTEVPLGDYVVAAMAKGGAAREHVTVSESNKNPTVSLTLKAREGGKGKKPPQ